MTSISNGQFTVHSEEEIMNRCTQANFVDCRINAYPESTKWEKYDLVRYPPNFLFFDLDLTLFTKYKNPKRLLDMALRKTINKISTLIPKHFETLPSQPKFSKVSGSNINPLLFESTHVEPTILWTGNGYHIYLPINAIVLDQEVYFSKDQFPNLFSLTSKYFNWSVSEVFLKYAEIYFTDGRADPLHNPKYKTCLIRIPGSYNSKLLKKGFDKEASQVKIIQRWNGTKIPIQYLLKEFRRWLIQEEYNLKLKKGAVSPSYNVIIRTNNKIDWIEKLLQTPLEDFRKYCLFHILVPYLLNYRNNSIEESSKILELWLHKSNELRPIDFNPIIEVRNRIKFVKKFKPLSVLKLRIYNIELYHLLKTKDLV
jgi:hypothetical protein